MKVKEKELKDVNEYIDNWFKDKRDEEIVEQLFSNKIIHRDVIKTKLKKEFKKDNHNNRRGKIEDNRKVRPDIIIHRRGTQENFLIIEIKKSSNFNIDNVLYDIIKLELYQKQLHYRYCLFVRFNIDKYRNYCSLSWYKPTNNFEYFWDLNTLYTFRKKDNKKTI